MTDIPRGATTTAVFEGSLSEGGVSFSGYYEDFYDADWIKISLVAGTTYHFYGSDMLPGANTGDSVLQLFNAASVLVATDDDGGVGANSNLTFTASSTGTYFVAIHDYDANPGQYSIDVTSTVATDHQLTDSADIYTGAIGERILGGRGDDIITVGAGLDALGEQGNDIIEGNDGANFISGGTGNDTIFGNGGNDTLFGGVGDDYASGGDGDDRIFGGDGGDLLYGGVGNDAIRGGNGADYISGGDGNDTLSGDAGNDRLQGDAGADKLNGGTGADWMLGGDGNDSYVVDNAGDVVNEDGSDGVDKVSSSISFDLSNATRSIGNVENLTLTGSASINGTGNALANVITGNAGNNSLSGNEGNDTLKGGDGQDKLTGGLGADKLTGGAGADTFLFNLVSESTPVAASRDVIYDFSHAEGDKISLAAIDANAGAAGNQAFSFIGTAAFSHHAGELRFTTQSGNVYVYGDTNGDGTADFSIQVNGLAAITAADFIL